MSGSLETIVTGLGFVEALRWHSDRLWFSDFGSRKVQSVDAAGLMREEAWVPGQPSGLGFAPDGALMVASVHEGHVLRFGPEGHFAVADIGATYRGGLNDMLTLHDGSCYVSAFPEPVIGRVAPPVPADGGSVPLFHVRPNGQVRIVAEGIKIPNGIAISNDGRTLFVAEVFGNCILAFDVHSDGSLSNRRQYADLGHRNPDGISIDSQDRLWVGCPFVSEFVRVGTSGIIDDIITIPGLWTIACAVGENDDELWCGAVATSIEDYQRGRASGSIMRWRR